MRGILSVAALALLLSPTTARADDLATALSFAQSVMGDHIVDGYEDFVDYDETEALPLLLSDTVVPQAAPQHYESGETLGFAPRTSFYRTLGSTRLRYQDVEPHVQEAAQLTGLPAALIDAVIRTESGYRTRVVSRAGAVGLMQLLPKTAASVGVSDLYDPRQNIIGGSRYLRKMYDRFGEIRMAIAAYNAGPGAVAKHGGIPPFKETKRYVRTVLRRYQNSPIR